MWEGWEGCTRSPPGLRTTAPRIDGTRARFPRFPHPPPPLRRCLWEGWEGRPRPHPPAAPGPSHSERARARFPRFPQDSTAIPAALRPKDPWHNAPRRRQAAEKTKNGRKPAGFAASPHHRRPLSYPLAFSWRVHRENWPALRCRTRLTLICYPRARWPMASGAGPHRENWPEVCVPLCLRQLSLTGQGPKSLPGRVAVS